MHDRTRARHRALIAALVAARLLLPLLLIHPAWEFHRDELLYFAMGDHLEFFRMQFPPFIAVIARLSSSIFGDSVLAARVPAALGGAGLLAAMLLTARRLGAGVWSFVLIALASVAAPVFLRPSVLFQPVIFDQLWCTLAIAGIALAAAEDEPRWWLLTGLGLGLGAMTKFSTAFYAVCIASTVLLLPTPRRQLRTRWPWLGAGLAVLLGSPSLTGQWVNDWPFPTQMAQLQSSQLEHVSNLSFLAEQPLMLGTGTLLVVIAIIAGFGSRRADRIALLFGGLLVGLMLVLDGKAYYAAPAYPLLVVTGAMAIERRVRSTGRPWPAWSAIVVMVPVMLFMLPIGVPLLAPDAMARYAQRLGLSAAVRTNRGEILPLPQDYADMLGWRAQAEAVAAVYDSLPPADRDRVIIAADNYGEAGALAMYRRRHAYPYPVSVVGDFHAWGPGSRSGEVGIVLTQPSAETGLREIWSDVRIVRRLGDPRGVPEEQNLCIFVVRGLRRPLEDVWSERGPVWG